MKTKEEWNNEFKFRVAEAVAKPVSYDMNKIIMDLAEDIQNDALGIQPIIRPKLGVITKAEAEAQSNVVDFTIDGKVPTETDGEGKSDAVA